MIIKKLVIENLGMIENEEIVFEKSLNLFFGDIQQGKTTILNAVKLCFGGSFPQDIIRHGEKEAKVALVFDDRSISRSFYVNKDGKTVARSIIYILNGLPVDKPVDKIKELVNPFMLDQDYLVKMNAPDRQRYFVDFLDIDTKEDDAVIVSNEATAKELRAEIKGYGEIVVETVAKPADITVLETELLSIKTFNKKQALLSLNMADKDEDILRKTDAIALKIEDLKQYVLDAEASIAQEKVELAALITAKALMPVAEQAKPTEEIALKISDNKADQVKYDQYLKDKKRLEEKEQKEQDLYFATTKIAEHRKSKIALLAEAAKNSGVAGLEFDDEGNFRYENTASDMLSTSQMMKLSSVLSSLYPEGLGIELIDRAESLGKSIYDYVAKAEKENKTILASIVGERPAEEKEEVGVFVVEKGKVSA